MEIKVRVKCVGYRLGTPSDTRCRAFVNIGGTCTGLGGKSQHCDEYTGLVEKWVDKEEVLKGQR